MQEDQWLLQVIRWLWGRSSSVFAHLGISVPVALCGETRLLQGKGLWPGGLLSTSSCSQPTPSSLCTYILSLHTTHTLGLQRGPGSLSDLRASWFWDGCFHSSWKQQLLFNQLYFHWTHTCVQTLPTPCHWALLVHISPRRLFSHAHLVLHGAVRIVDSPPSGK